MLVNEVSRQLYLFSNPLNPYTTFSALKKIDNKTKTTIIFT